MEMYEQTPTELMADFILGGEVLTDEIKENFCRFNSVYFKRHKPNDNFFNSIVSKCFNQLCINNNIFVKEINKFEVKNLRRCNVYLVTYSNGEAEFNCYYINKVGDNLLTGGGELFKYMERILVNKGCLYCNYNENGCDECNSEAIKSIIELIPRDYVDEGNAHFNNFASLFGSKNINAIEDFMNYYINFSSRQKDEVKEREIDSDKPIFKNSTKDLPVDCPANPLLDKFISEIGSLDKKVLKVIKDFLMEFFSSYKEDKEVRRLLKGCHNIDGTIAYLLKMVSNLRSGVEIIEQGDIKEYKKVMESFLQEFFA